MMETVQSETWPPTPEQSSELPNFFEVEGMRVTRTKDTLRIENRVSLMALRILPLFPAIIYPAFIASKSVLAYKRGHIHLLIHSRHVLMLALIKLIGEVLLFALVFYILLSFMMWNLTIWLLLLEKPGAEKTKMPVNFGVLRTVKGICIAKIPTLRGSLYYLLLTRSISTRWPRWIYKDDCRFGVFHDEANAERVAQMIADFANVPIERRNMER